MKPRDADLLLDRALAEFPVEPLPRGFVARTMAQIEAKNSPSAATAWRPSFGFFDVALPAIAALLAFVVALGATFLWGARDPVAIAALEAQVSLRWLLWSGSAAQQPAWPSAANAVPVAVVLAVSIVALAIGTASGRMAWRRVSLTS